MTGPNPRTPGRAAAPAVSRRDYKVHPLAALDGVLIYVALNGETVGYFFGKTEKAAAEALAAALLQHAAAACEQNELMTALRARRHGRATFERAERD